jgi:hypothetical protein
MLRAWEAAKAADPQAEARRQAFQETINAVMLRRMMPRLLQAVATSTRRGQVIERDTNCCRRVVLSAEVITVPRDEIDINVTDDDDEVRISIKAASPKSEFRAWLTPEHARQVGATLMRIADRVEGHN